MPELEFWVNGMTCEHCERAVTAELISLTGVDAARVDAASGRVLVSSAGPADRADLERAVEEAGYTVRSWSPSSDA